METSPASMCDAHSRQESLRPGEKEKGAGASAVSGGRFKQIDMLRALAVVLVLGRHMEPCPAEVNAWVHAFTTRWWLGGWVGVDLFFVLSGFLVSGLLFREYEKYRELRIGHFFIRRGFKIYPPFWVLILVAVLVGWFQHQALPVKSVVCELIFLQNYGPAVWNHTWSLAVEEHFYILLALLFWWLSKRRTERPFRAVPLVFVGVALVCLALRLYVGAHAPYRHKTHLVPTHLRLDSLFFGVVLSYFFHRYPVRFVEGARKWRWLLLGLGAVLLTPAFCFKLESTPFLSSYGFALFYLGGGCLLVGALGCATPRLRLARGLAYLGAHSYSVYLWHIPVAAWGGGWVLALLGHPGGWFVTTGTYLAGSVLVGIGMSLLVEFPVLRLRDRLFPSRGRPLTTDAVGALGSAAPGVDEK